MGGGRSVRRRSARSRSSAGSRWPSCSNQPGVDRRGVLPTARAGQPIIFGGDQVTTVPAELAAAFRAGDRLLVVQETGELLHVPAADHRCVDAAVGAAVPRVHRAGALRRRRSEFFDEFAGAAGRRRGCRRRSARPTTPTSARRRRRAFDDPARADAERCATDMVAGLHAWRDAPHRRDECSTGVDHDGWSVEAWRAPLGVVGFVFEGRPNVFADATGVLRTGNTVVMRIGSDALGTAEAIIAGALDPALEAAGLPAGCSCPRALAGPLGRLGAVRRPSPRPGRRPRLGSRRRRVERRRPPGRHPRQRSTGLAERGSSPVRPPTSTASGPASSTRWTARCATR